MAAEWYCRLMGTELGPFTSAQLLEMAQMHRVTPEDLVKKGARGEWVPAYRVKGLFKPAQVSAVIAADVPQPALADAPPGGPTPLPAAPANRLSSLAAAPSPAAAAMRIDGAQMREDWFFIAAGQKYGPMSFDRLQQHVAEGVLHATDRVWSSASPKWLEAQRVRGLRFE